MFQVNAFAIQKTVDTERHLGGRDGWIDSYEDTSIWVEGEVIPQTALTTQTGAQCDNKIMIAMDPKGQGGQCLEFQFNKYSQEVINNSRNNPSFEPSVASQLMSIAYNGDCQMSFDMYLPENFAASGSDYTKIDMLICSKMTGSVSSSHYQQATITKDGLYITDFPQSALPIGRWFNVKYIIHCDVSNGIKGDLYIDGMEIAKNRATRFTFAGGGGSESIAQNGIASVRFTASTTNSGNSLDTPCSIYFDNFDFRACKDVDVLTYSYSSGMNGDDVLCDGFNSFKVKIRNNSEEAVTPVVGMTLLKDGAVDSTYFAMPKTIAPGTDEDLEINEFLPALDDGDYEVRTFVWDGEETMNSIMEQLVIKEGYYEEN